MRRQILTMLALIPVLLVAGPAFSQNLQLDGGADCEGWGAMATLEFPEGVYSAEMAYSVVLLDQAGAEVERIDRTEIVQRFEDPVMILMNDGQWGQALDSVYVATFTFHFLGLEAVMTRDVVCGEPQSDPEPETEPCHRSFRYWRRNTDLWPLAELEFGGVVMSREELVRFGHHTLHARYLGSLLRQTVAARLNVAAGCDPSILPVLEEAEELLGEALNGHRRRGWRAHRKYRVLRRQLAAYNNLPCESEFRPDFRGMVLFGDSEDTADLEAGMEDQTTFSGLKAMYR